MKSTLTFLLLGYGTIAFSQKYALIDRNFKKPILFTDSVTINQVANNYFPIRVNDLDSLLANCNYLVSELRQLQRAKFKSYKIRSGNTTVIITAFPKAYGDSYEILFQTTSGIVNAEYLIANSQQKNKRAIKNLIEFANYIKSDRDLVVHDFITYSPVIFDATVFIGSR